MLGTQIETEHMVVSKATWPSLTQSHATSISGLICCWDWYPEIYLVVWHLNIQRYFIQSQRSWTHRKLQNKVTLFIFIWCIGYAANNWMINMLAAQLHYFLSLFFPFSEFFFLFPSINFVIAVGVCALPATSSELNSLTPLWKNFEHDETLHGIFNLV